jgi:hypothetical protein
VEQEENHETGPSWSWARNQMENPGSNKYFVSKPTKRAGATRQGEDK